MDEQPTFTLDPDGRVRTLVLQGAGSGLMMMTIRGEPPKRLRYHGQMWSATGRTVHATGDTKAPEYQLEAPQP
jgi:hypothetical protein